MIKDFVKHKNLMQYTYLEQGRVRFVLGKLNIKHILSIIRLQTNFFVQKSTPFSHTRPDVSILTYNMESLNQDKFINNQSVSIF